MSAFGSWNPIKPNDEEDEIPPELPQTKLPHNIGSWNAEFPPPNPLDKKDDRKVDLEINGKEKKSVFPWFKR